MDIIARLILCCIFALCCGQVFAYGKVTKETKTVVNCSGTKVNSTIVKGSGASFSEACAPLLAAVKASYTDPYFGQDKSYTIAPTCTQDAPGVNQGGCWGTFKCGGAGLCAISAMGSKVVENVCPDGSSPVAGSVCQCNLGSKPGAGNVCEVYSCPPSGSHYGVVPDIKVSDAGQSICRNGCTETPSSWKVGADDAIWAVSPFRSSGEFCGGSKSPENVDTGSDNFPPAPVPCGAGMCPGTVNGASVCVACKSENIKGPSEAASGVTAGNDANGVIKKSEKQTSCVGTLCTTVTIYKDQAGAVVGTDTKTEPKENFCQQNPGLSICKEGSFGGSCGAFTCQGDAVQCALAKEVHRANCEWQKVDDSLKQKGNDAIAGGLRPADHPGSNTEGTSLAFSSVIDQTERIGSGCPVDVSVGYAGRTWVIPWSQHCDKLQLIGNLMVAVCMLAAAVIVFRG